MRQRLPLLLAIKLPSIRSKNLMMHSSSIENRPRRDRQLAIANATVLCSRFYGRHATGTVLPMFAT
ncbi:MAG TPA: hypothetical protein PKJ85_12205 [Nitrosomonas nitrosa]|nr:hypothetical protein [Nitrosomonas nitrosa]